MIAIDSYFDGTRIIEEYYLSDQEWLEMVQCYLADKPQSRPVIEKIDILLRDVTNRTLMKNKWRVGKGKTAFNDFFDFFMLKAMRHMLRHYVNRLDIMIPSQVVFYAVTYHSQEWNANKRVYDRSRIRLENADELPHPILTTTSNIQDLQRIVKAHIRRMIKLTPGERESIYRAVIGGHGYKELPKELKLGVNRNRFGYLYKRLTRSLSNSDELARNWVEATSVEWSDEVFSEFV